MKEKLITKSFERLLDKGLHRGFITYEELGKSLGKRGGSTENLEKAINMYTHIKIKLSKNKNGYLCQAISPFDNKKFQYSITSNGVTDES